MNLLPENLRNNPNIRLEIADDHGLGWCCNDVIVITGDGEYTLDNINYISIYDTVRLNAKNCKYVSSLENSTLNATNCKYVYSRGNSTLNATDCEDVSSYDNSTLNIIDCDDDFLKNT